MLTRSGLSRRRLIERASGSILLFPLLRVLDIAEAKAATALTKRAIFVHFGSGTYENTFWPTAGSTIGTLPMVTSPLESLKSEMILFHGLTQVGAGNHGGGQYQVLAGFGAYTGPEGNTPDTTGAVPNAYSVDQMIADKWGTSVMNLGIKSNSSDASFTKTISFDKTGKLMLAEDNPNAAFDKYFGMFQAPGGTTSQTEAKANVVSGRKRLLDYLKNDLKYLKDNLGPVDKEALEYHVSAIDKLNADLNSTMNPSTGGGVISASCDPTKLMKVTGVSDKWYHDAMNTPAVYTLQRRIIAQAFACNISRVATLQMGLSQLNGHIMTDGIPQLSQVHHMLAHGDNQQALDDFARLQQGQMKEIALLAQDLKSLKVGDHSSFDETLIYVATDIGAPATDHWSDNVATFMLGNLGGTMKGNRFIKIKGRPYNHALVTAAHLLGLTDINEVGYTKHSGPIKEVFT